jgi:hypothetical protein
MMPKIGVIAVRGYDEIELSLRFLSDEVLSYAPPDARTSRWLVHLRSHTKALALTTREVEVLIVGIRECRLAHEISGLGQ